MKLEQLMEGVPYTLVQGSPETEINDIIYDSRKAAPGLLFVCIVGTQRDSHEFAADCAAKGVSALVIQHDIDLTAVPGVTVVKVESSRYAMALMSANLFGNPSRKMTMIGVTGTKGKTTTTHMIKSVLEAASRKVGMIGTNGIYYMGRHKDTANTTPESYELQKTFREFLDAGCDTALMEVSSQGLMMDRVAGVHYDVGVFTNLTQDHLDFHKTMEEYRKAKALLFSISKKGVINLDDAAAEKMLADAKCPCMTFSCGKPEADLEATDLQLHADGVEFTAQYQGEKADVKLPIPGHFSVENALTALGIVLQLGMPLADAAKSMATATGVKGRVEVVPTDTDYTVLIDYAHSPDGVENVLKAVRGFAKGRVVALFGCGGDRDRTKRPKMGKIAADLADFCVVTSDNPRTEEPKAIIDDILEGMKDSDTPMQVIVDRPEAIHWALAHAQKDDIIVLMGKGHETYQEVNHVKHHMDEREIVADFFNK